MTDGRICTDSTIVATLSGPISASFNSFTLFSWLASGYLITNAAFQPLSGKLTDIYGRRAGLVFASTFFAIGTLMCGLATEEWVIILGRLVAGAGGGCLNTISTFVGSDLVPLRKRGIWQGIGNIVYGTGMGLGGLFGGAIHDSIGWRWAFLIQVPFIVFAGILSFFTVKVPIKKSETARIRRVDFLGSFALSVTLVLLLLGLNSGGNLVPWTHPLVLTTLPLSLVALFVFVYIEDRVASEPVIPVRLLAQQTVAAACLTNWFITMAVFALLYYVPIYFQTVLSLSSTAAGARLIPQSAGTALGSLSTGIIMRATGKYRLWNLGMQVLSLASAAAILATFTSSRVNAAAPFAYLFMGGTAYGSMLTITLISLIAAVEHKHQAVITSASYAFRSTGSTIGITISSAIFQNLLKAGLERRFGGFPGAEEEIGRIRDSVDEVHRLPEGWYDGVMEAYVESFRGVWVAALGFAALAALSSFFIKQHTLHGNLERK
jgi:MFS family permease